MSQSRLQVALPAILTFVFGLVAGLVVGRILWNAPSVPTSASAPAMPGGDMATAQQDSPHGDTGGPSEEELRKALTAHEAQLAKQPDDVNLNQTVGEYHAMLGENDRALELYAHAREVAEKAGDAARVTDIMIDEGVSLVDKGDVTGALKRLEEASARDAKDVRSRLTRIAIYVEKVMPSPPPGMDRKQAVAAAESLLDEVERIDPSNEYAKQYRQMIDGVRQMMGRPREAAAATGP